MHPVVKNILARQGGKVPINDGRKIALVLHGGLMTGIRGAGAMIALEELGLSHTFDVIYSVSAGFGNASYLLAEQAAFGTSVYYDDLSGKKFINFWKPWKIADIDQVIHAMKDIKRIDIEKIWESKTKLFIRLLNSKNHKMEYLEIHSFSPDIYFTLLRAAIYIQYIVPGSVKINGMPYMDTPPTPKNSIEHDRHALQSDATDILIIYNHQNQPKKEIQESDRICIITPDPVWNLSRFETRTDILKEAAIQMGTLVKKIFGYNKPINLDYHGRY